MKITYDVRKDVTNKWMVEGSDKKTTRRWYVTKYRP